MGKVIKLQEYRELKEQRERKDWNDFWENFSLNEDEVENIDSLQLQEEIKVMIEKYKNRV